MLNDNSKVHISLNVKNVNESIRFYEKMFNAKPVKHFDDYAKFDLVNPPLNLALTQTVFTSGGSLSHLGVQVFSSGEVLETRDRWIKSGLVTFDEMQTNCCYAKQDKTWIKDPDGNEWEVFVVLGDVPEEKMKETKSSCCQQNPNGSGKQIDSVQNCC